MEKGKKKEPDGYELKDIYSEMEMELVRSFYRNFVKHNRDEITAGFSWEMWQVAMLRNIEDYRKENATIIGRFRPSVKAAVDQVLRKAYAKGQKNVKQRAEQAQICPDAGSYAMPEDGLNAGNPGETAPKEDKFFQVNSRKLDAMIEATTNDMQQADYAIHRKMDDVYRQTIYNAKIQLGNGAVSLDKAIDIASEDFLEKGINCIAYKDRNDKILRYVNIATYAEMALRTTQHRARLLGEGAMRDRIGVHLVFVSSHPNCCKLCLPWQAQVLIDDVFSHPEDTYISKYSEKYRLLSEAIKAGLLHPNCRHTLATYFEGITRLPKKYDEETTDRNYKAEQKQRYLENMIRKAKRYLEGSVDAEDKKKAKQSILHYQRELRNHLKEHPELKRHSHREKIYQKNGNIVVKEDDGLNIKQFFQNKKSDLPDAFQYSESKKANIESTMKELLENGRSTGNEYVSINDYVTGEKLSSIYTDNKPNKCTPSWKMIRLLKSSPENSISFIHNHPRSTSFSVSDVLMMAKAKSIKEIIAVGHDGTEYYISLSKSDKIILSSINNIQKFINDVQNRRGVWREKGYSASEAKDIVWEEIANERGWNYGKRSK